MKGWFVLFPKNDLRPALILKIGLLGFLCLEFWAPALDKITSEVL
jgi:hypothetical protein